eukprot:TRINITY_DN2867_c0_g1_i2.p1 TRINITY_DN2867_c0_g1~~TRINITY_DN2867_c0_g1_i2.p1  ORF type:complete len:60 (+),score=4.93 TRINITY_DN2867_c0_g1_i2:215-394(+)
MGVIPSKKSLSQCDNLSASAFLQASPSCCDGSIEDVAKSQGSNNFHRARARSHWSGDDS